MGQAHTSQAQVQLVVAEAWAAQNPHHQFYLSVNFFLFFHLPLH